MSEKTKAYEQALAIAANLTTATLQDESAAGWVMRALRGQGVILTQDDLRDVAEKAVREVRRRGK